VRISDTVTLTLTLALTLTQTVTLILALPLLAKRKDEKRDTKNQPNSGNLLTSNFNTNLIITLTLTLILPLKSLFKTFPPSGLLESLVRNPSLQSWFNINVQRVSGTMPSDFSLYLVIFCRIRFS